jgi:hypothetical protein
VSKRHCEQSACDRCNSSNGPRTGMEMCRQEVIAGNHFFSPNPAGRANPTDVRQNPVRRNRDGLLTAARAAGCCGRFVMRGTRVRPPAGRVVNLLQGAVLFSS